APQLKQAKRIAWRYLKLYGKKIPGTKINQTDLTIEFANGAMIRIMGADRPDTIRGDYFDGVVIDEVAQIKVQLWGEVIRPMLADRKGWALFIGTPKGINLFSEIYYRAIADPLHWFVARYTCYDTDALPADEIASIKADQTALEFRQEMLCDFTASGTNTLISIDVAMAAAARTIEPRLYEYAPKILGVDVAWEGGDRCAIFKRQGLKTWPPVVIPGLPEKTFAIKVAEVINEFHPAQTFVDTTGGYGGEVVSRLKDGHHKVQGVVFSWAAANERYLNLRAEMWFKMADWLKEGGSIPNRTDLISELCAPTYSNDNSANRLQLESKDDIKERLGFSPDIADALALTFAFPVALPRPEPDRKVHVSAWS
nr:terminase family protein [Terrimicrobiaceae bacterium]